MIKMRIPITVALFSVLSLGSLACDTVVNVDSVDFCQEKVKKVGNVTVHPTSLALKVGESVHLTADVVDPQGEWTLCLPLPRFTSTDPAIATAVDDTGIGHHGGTVMGAKAGNVYVKATSNGVSDSLLVTVVEPN